LTLLPAQQLSAFPVMAGMLSIAFFSLVFAIAGAEKDIAVAPERQLGTTDCMLTVTNSIAELMKAGTFLWSAIERCENTKDGVRCSSDILSTIEHVLTMSGIIVKTVSACGDGEEASKCTATSLKLASASAGLTAASLEMSKACKPKVLPYPDQKFPLDDSVPCLGNIAASVSGLGNTIAGLAEIEKKCKANKLSCATHTMDILSTIASMGGAIYGTVSGSCIVDKALGVQNECVVSTIHAAKSLMTVGSAGLTLSGDCKLAESRLWEAGSQVSPTMSAFTPLNTALAALFPFTAVVAFVRGSRKAAPEEVDEKEDVELLQEYSVPA